MPDKSSTDAISSEEARALLTVGWELADKLNKILTRLDQLLGPHPSDPRNKPAPFKSCY
jgi:hypothetical protein